MSMGFNDDGLGAAMAQSYAREAGERAQREVKALEARVAALESTVREMEAMIWPLGR